MRKILQPALMRGHVADRVAVALLLGLLAVLCISVIQGMHTLTF